MTDFKYVIKTLDGFYATLDVVKFVSDDSINLNYRLSPAFITLFNTIEDADKVITELKKANPYTSFVVINMSTLKEVKTVF
jgi:hypothetical protein